MGMPVLILGKSGSGKSTSLRSIDPEDALLIQTIKKPLPFKSTEWKQWNFETKQGSVYCTDKASHIIACIKNAKSNGKSIVIVDDFQYQMSNTFMRRAFEKGYNKFTEIGKDAWDIVQAAINVEDDTRVYILSHTYEDELGENIRMKTIGKMLDDKITMEGMFTIVLRCILNDGEHFFSTKNNGKDTVKSPMELFDKGEITNDLGMVDDKICGYYEIHSSEELLEKIENIKGNFKDGEYIKTVSQYVEKVKDNPTKLRSIINKLKLKLNEGEENE